MVGATGASARPDFKNAETPRATLTRGADFPFKTLDDGSFSTVFLIEIDLTCSFARDGPDTSDTTRGRFTREQNTRLDSHL